MDKRVERTKKSLQNSLAKLMMTRPLSQITVRELVNEAQINRSTFYLHYQDVEELLTEIQTDILEQLKAALDEHPIKRGESTLLFFKEVFYVIDQNRDICRALLGEYGDIAFLRKIESFLEDACQGIWTEYSDKVQKGSEKIFYSFCMQSGLSYIRLWLETEPRTDYEAAAVLIYKMIKSSMDVFVEAGI